MPLQPEQSPKFIEGTRIDEISRRDANATMAVVGLSRMPTERPAIAPDLLIVCKRNHRERAYPIQNSMLETAGLITPPKLARRRALLARSRTRRKDAQER